MCFLFVGGSMPFPFHHAQVTASSVMSTAASNSGRSFVASALADSASALVGFIRAAATAVARCTGVLGCLPPSPFLDGPLGIAIGRDGRDLVSIAAILPRLTMAVQAGHMPFCMHFV